MDEDYPINNTINNRSTNYMEPINDTQYNSQSLAITHESIAMLIQEFKDSFNFNVNVSALILDIHNNKTVASYGDIDNYHNAAFVFMPISAAILVNEYTLDIQQEFEHLPYILNENPLMDPLAILAWPDDIYGGYISFKQGVLDGSLSTYFRAFDNKAPSLFLNAFENFNLRNIDAGPNAYREYVWQAIGNFPISTRELALSYAALVNGGRLFADINSQSYQRVFSEYAASQGMSIVAENLHTTDYNWQTFRPIRDKKQYSSFRDNIIGSAATFTSDRHLATDEITGAWFIGMYPAYSPRYMMVLNAFHYMDDVFQYYSDLPHYRSAPMVRMHELSVLAYELYAGLLRSDAKNMVIEGIVTDFLPRIESISLLTDGVFEGFIYVGRDTCPSCLIFNVHLKELIQSNPELEIYYFDTDYWRGNEYFSYVIEKFSILGVPALLRINDGIFHTMMPHVANYEDIYFLKEFLGVH